MKHCELPPLPHEAQAGVVHLIMFPKRFSFSDKKYHVLFLISIIIRDAPYLVNIETSLPRKRKPVAKE